MCCRRTAVAGSRNMSGGEKLIHAQELRVRIRPDAVVGLRLARPFLPANMFDGPSVSVVFVMDDAGRAPADARSHCGLHAKSRQGRERGAVRQCRVDPGEPPRLRYARRAEAFNQLVFGRLPDRALGVTMLPLSRPSKAVDMPDRGSYWGRA